MAICGLRADSFSFGLPEGGVLRPLLSLLEKAEKGFPAGDMEAEWAEIIEASTRAGYLAVREERILLQPDGKRLLEFLRRLFPDVPTPR